MSIHDVDKTGAGRDSPMPNSHDEQGLARMAHGTNSINYKGPGSSTVNATTGIFEIANIVDVSYTLTGYEPPSITRFTLSFPHGLGFSPTVIGSLINTADSKSRLMPYTWTTYDAGSALSIQGARVSVDSVDNTNIIVLVESFTLAGLSYLLSNNTLTFKFYCMRMRIAT